MTVPPGASWSQLARLYNEFFKQLMGRYGSVSPIEHMTARTFRDPNGTVIGRMDVLDGSANSSRGE